MTTIVIIGGGVVGCAIAEQLSSHPNTEIHILEKNESIGEGVTSRNSGVIHAGLYYPPSSLKAKLCIEGQELLYEWCHKHSVPHRKTGKLVVAETLVAENDLHSLYQNALASGVNSNTLRIISKSEMQKINPNIQGVLALYSMSTGIVDSQALCRSFYGEAFKKNVSFHFRCEVTGITKKDKFVLETSRGEMECDVVINAAGLYADEVAALAGVTKYKIYPWRGDYFRIKLPYPIKELVYPLKRPKGGLGIHLTFDTQSHYFLGPDIEPCLSKDDFKEKPEKLDLFYEAASRLLKGISKDMLSYETCGIRPKLRSFESQEEKDFIVSEDLPGFFNLVGIESPGLTASLAIAKHIDKVVF